MLYWIEFLWILLSKVGNFSLVIMLTALIIRCRLHHVLMKFSCSQYQAFQKRPVFSTLEILMQHSFLVSVLCMVENLKIMVIVLRKHSNFRVIIWCWQHASTYFLVLLQDHWRLNSVWFIAIGSLHALITWSTFGKHENSSLLKTFVSKIWKSVLKLSNLRSFSRAS